MFFGTIIFILGYFINVQKYEVISDETRDYEVVEMYISGVNLYTTIRDTQANELITGLYVGTSYNETTMNIVCTNWRSKVGQKIYLQKIIKKHKNSKEEIEIKHTNRLC